MDGYKDRVERDARQLDQINLLLGSYIATGINDPKHYPKQPLMFKSTEPKQSVESFMLMAKQRYGKKEE